MSLVPLLFLAAQAGPPVLVSEVVDPTAKVLRVEIVASLPTVSAKERAIADLLGPAIARGTLAYPRANLLSTTSRGGQSLTVRAMADHLRVGFSLAARDFDVAVELCDQIVREALMPTEDLQLLIDEYPFVSRQPWTQVWFPTQGDVKGVKPENLKAAYRSAFKPGHVSIAVGGSFASGEFRRRLGERFDSWVVKAQPSPRPISRDPEAKFLEKHRGSYSFVLIQGSPISVVSTISNDAPKGPSLADGVVAATLIGFAKSGELFQVVREELGQSYRQEAGLIPDAAGVRPTAVWATTKPEPGPAIEAVRKRVAAWTQVDLDRARRTITEFSVLSLPLSPYYFSGDRPLINSLEDRTFLNAYWRLKTGRAWAQPDLRNVTIESVRQLALDWIKPENVRVIPGR